MEIDVTEFVRNEDPAYYSASRAELGENAARITWSHAMEQGGDMLASPESLQVMRDWALASGGWDNEEIAAWSDTELNALFVQLISGDMREAGLDAYEESEFDWSEYEALAQAGQISGNFFRASDGRIFFTLDS